MACRLFGGKPSPEPMLTYSVRETNARPLANVSAFWAGRVENWPGQVEFCVKHVKDFCFQASAPKIKFPPLSIGLLRTNLSEVRIKILNFTFMKMPSEKCHLRNGDHFVQGEMSQPIEAEWHVYASMN